VASRFRCPIRGVTFVMPEERYRQGDYVYPGNGMGQNEAKKPRLI